MHRTVDFFIVGEPKSGTTALAKFLGQHPDVGISTPKEPHYFATDLHRESDDFHQGKKRHFEVRTFEQYQQCFAPVSDKPVWGEASTHYMVSHEAAQNIRVYNPDAKIIVMLRHPVDFLHSLHMQYVNNGSEDEPSFERALLLENDRRAGRSVPKATRCPSHLFYSERVRYAEHLQRFISQFPGNQIKVIITEEFNSNNQDTFLEVLEFLGLNTNIELPTFGVVHGSKAPRFRLLHKLFNSLVVKNFIRNVFGPRRYDAIKSKAALIFLKHQNRETLPASLREELMSQFKPEVRKIARLLDKPGLSQLWGYKVQ